MGSDTWLHLSFFAQCEEIRKFDIQNHAITLSIEMLFEKTYTLYPPRPQRLFLNKTRDLFKNRFESPLSFLTGEPGTKSLIWFYELENSCMMQNIRFSEYPWSMISHFLYLSLLFILNMHYLD